MNRENFDIACGHLQMRTRSVVLALLLITIAACAPIRQFEPAMGDAYMGAFLRGEVKLSCRIACFGTDGLNSAKRKALYDQARWQELVLLVIGIGYEQDLNYFYLGRAAEELGSPSAAKVYFKLSKMEKADDHCCVGSSCLGFQFPQDAEVRLSALTAAKPKDLSDPFAAPSAIAAVEPKQGDDPTTLRTLADQGDARAQWNLGVKYANGDGVTQDDAEALKWGRKAADQGNAFAQNGLGLIYLGGQGVAQNYAEAMTWFRKAADQGYASAQGNLGVMYYYGQGVPQNFIEAAKYLRLAADQGYPDAENWLGFLYGNGVPQDYVEAYKWYSLAAAGSTVTAIRDQATKSRDIIASSMTPTQLAKAQELARDWNPAGGRASELPVDPDERRSPSLGPSNSSSLTIPLRKEGGTFVVPVVINSAITLNFVVDSGAADVTIPGDVVLTLVRTGTLRDSDFLGEQTYVLADGSKVPSNTFRIRSLKVGNKTIKNVVSSIAPVQGSLLLGQSFLSRFKSWSIDNQKRVLILE